MRRYYFKRRKTEYVDGGDCAVEIQTPEVVMSEISAAQARRLAREKFAGLRGYVVEPTFVAATPRSLKR
ncbi:MAG: hypothetical protein OXE40_19110 [Gammaproteobacteria bacterium]|nr:hypothetical protein [Gammaproteobacteria bacterium]